MAAYGGEGVLCVDVAVGCCRMPTVVLSRMAPCHSREESIFNVREYLLSSCGGESMKHTLAVASSQRQPNRQRRSPPLVELPSPALGCG
jgi:hypothetical protein